MPSQTSERQLQDYARVEAAIEWLRAHQHEQPGLTELAAAMHLSEFHLQRLFSRWAGISPKRFVQCLTVAHAKQQLADSADVLSASHAAGLSGPGRLHDLFIRLEAMTPGEFKQGGAGLEIAYGFHATPLGECLIGQTARGVCYLGFRAEQSRDELCADLLKRWPQARLRADARQTVAIAEQIFQSGADRPAPLHLLVRGTNFQVQVWRALLQIPEGRVSNYAAVAQSIGRPGASRAVGSAIGANPIAWLIPCHRVLRGDGQLGGYHWGLARKQACLIWEGAHSSTGAPE